MKVEVDLTEYGVKTPKWYDPINPHVINASGGSGGGDVELTFAEYEALSEEEKMNGSNYFITDIGNPKSLTSKVLLLESNLTTTTYNLNDSIENYDYLYVNLAWQNKGSRLFSILKVSDIIYKSNGSNYGVVGTVDVNFAYLNYRFNSSTQIAIWQKSSSIPNEFVLTITGYRYERVVVPNQMVNYSTVEQRIGTWVDGKPLYQKTISKSYDELTTYGVRKGFLLDVANAVLHNVEAYAYSPTYGICFLGCKNYESNSSSSEYMECNMYYRIVVIEHSAGLSRLDENTRRPSLTATFQYTKTTD